MPTAIHAYTVEKSAVLWRALRRWDTQQATCHLLRCLYLKYGSKVNGNLGHTKLSTILNLVHRYRDSDISTLQLYECSYPSIFLLHICVIVSLVHLGALRAI